MVCDDVVCDCEDCGVFVGGEVDVFVEVGVFGVWCDVWVEG